MTWLVVGLAVVLLLALANQAVGTLTVLEYERALRFVRGRFDTVLPAGQYWFVRRTTSFRKIDLRPGFHAVSGQEVLSADGVAFKASLLASVRVVDPTAAILGVEDLTGAIHAHLQLALRAAITGATAEDLLQRRTELSGQILAAAAPPLAVLGLELQSAAVRDLTLPGDLKKVFSQVVRARQEGLAALERARGETAALRSLANAAAMAQRSPALLQLRLLQVLGERAGHTVVFGAPAGAVPVPVSATDAPDPDTEPPSASE